MAVMVAQAIHLAAATFVILTLPVDVAKGRDRTAGTRYRHRSPS
jgi:hypothetical protein